MKVLKNRIQRELALLREIRRERSLRSSVVQGARMWLDGREVLHFASNDYLGLSFEPGVREAAQAASIRYGGGATGSRLISGNHPELVMLEAELASWHDAEASLVFSSGYAANVGVISALAQPEDVIFSDELNHASIIDGCRMTRSKVVVYRHADLEHLYRLLRKTRCQGQRFVVTDAVFSMDGDIAPIGDLLGVARSFEAITVLDDAHGVGVLGTRGAGTLEALGIPFADDIVVIGTLSKALAAQGAYVVGRRILIDYLVNRARSFIFSTGLAPSCAAAARKARKIAEHEAWRREKVLSLSAALRAGIRKLGYLVLDGSTTIVPVVVGDEHSVMEMSDFFLENGVYVPAIRPPSVPEGQCRLRLCVTAAHEMSDIERVLTMFGEWKQVAHSDYLVTSLVTGGERR
ncbi:8-amino-7-oxononanoate synthase [Alicyclobacillus mali]|uniref:8-amino-7-ketopelargonate synthase n=1 Tax=Alicyclobacillus mali (ex Roth et al. 2021) TaxID=1123961 RepID=A0ABS0F1Z9_9BACL|nr:8-amino-7-oxononanoate synthase [Alicyclobacillus mali (ex Roth et al. 2021)]MBF8377320.1 8-amino-7-oxononanoate synthase [Alicyclobacillus mali (ex Roth et al. 2021)]